MTNFKTSIIWFRKDLRISDNLALVDAIKNSKSIIPVFIHDEESENLRDIGSATKWFLHHSLDSLTKVLKEKYNCDLILKSGKSKDVLEELVSETKADAVYRNRLYEPFNVVRDSEIKEFLENKNVEVKTFNSSLIVEPWELKTGGGGSYRVYSPFYKNARTREVRPPARVANSEDKRSSESLSSENLEDWRFLPTQPDWSTGFSEYWSDISEEGAQNRLYYFLDEKVNDYSDKRNRPDMSFTSLLSPYLAWGLISPNQICSVASSYLEQAKITEKEHNKFISEVYWREFSYNLIFNFAVDPESENKYEIAGSYKEFHKDNFSEKFNKFPWGNNESHLEKWKKGQTGYPIVDAGMRQLWQTGWVHNRVRMVVGSFLVKNLLIHWHEGEKWFWDCLVDADYANNSASWQWIAGCGADAAPYFRVFNPILQGEKFDPKGEYVKKWIPELKDVPTKYIHKPWEAESDLLSVGNIKYPDPIVDLRNSRDSALEAYKKIK